MKKEEFLNALQDVLQREKPVYETDEIAVYEEWDSLSKMAVMAYFNETFGIKTNFNEINAASKVSDLIKLAGDKIQ
jgi:acyl carrier protein